jgi:hypothetical protein
MQGAKSIDTVASFVELLSVISFKKQDILFRGMNSKEALSVADLLPILPTGTALSFAPIIVDNSTLDTGGHFEISKMSNSASSFSSSVWCEIKHITAVMLRR